MGEFYQSLCWVYSNMEYIEIAAHCFNEHLEPEMLIAIFEDPIRYEEYVVPALLDLCGFDGDTSPKRVLAIRLTCLGLIRSIKIYGEQAVVDDLLALIKHELIDKENPPEKHLSTFFFGC